MDENRVAETIRYYRRRKGLSQEKVAEAAGVSRQAVTKWENGAARPSSDNLIRLAELFEVSVETLLGGGEPAQEKLSLGRLPWIFSGISVLCIAAYLVKCAISGSFSMGTLVCMFVICVPIQLFLNAYFSNAIRQDSFDGIAGFDAKTEYNVRELKKLLIQLDLHIESMSAVYVFLLCAAGCADFKIEWLNGFLVFMYTVNFILTVGILNYKMTDKIYRRDSDKKRAKRSMPLAAVYSLLLIAGIGMFFIVFERKGLENNTLPAIKMAGLLLLNAAVATVGFALENRRIKNWKPESESCKPGKAGVASLILCVIICIVMCAV